MASVLQVFPEPDLLTSEDSARDRELSTEPTVVPNPTLRSETESSELSLLKKPSSSSELCSRGRRTTVLKLIRRRPRSPRRARNNRDNGSSLVQHLGVLGFWGFGVLGGGSEGYFERN